MARGRPKKDPVVTSLVSEKLVGVVEVKRGRPALPIDKDMLLKLSETMLPIESIAMIMGCCPATLYSKYLDIIHVGREGRKRGLLECMWYKATVEKDTKMMIWLSKQYLDHRDTQVSVEQSINFNITTSDVPI